MPKIETEMYSTLNYHQHFKDKLSSHEPSHIHNTRHRTKLILILSYLIIQKHNNVICTKLLANGTAYQIRLKIALPSLYSKI